MQCPSKAVLVRLVREGTIADDAGFSADELEQHLTVCEDCQSFLLRLEAVSDSPKTLGRPPNTPLLDVEQITAGRKFGRYLLEELVGTGGHSHVYKARHETTGRLVAIKILLQRDVPSERLKAWKRESRLAGRLSHPHVVQILDADQVDGYEYSVFEWMPGGTLSDKIRTSLLSPKLSAEYARDLALGCESLHERRILHRDIKPSNILLDASGKVKLADFGIARSLDETVSIEASEIIGTLGYMSPEQLGTISSVPAETTDVYGIGAVLYAMLVGKGPFAGSDQAEVLSNATRGEVVGPSRFRKIPKDLETICLKCLEQKPEDRYPSTKALAADLEHFLIGDPIAAARPSLIRRARKFVRRQPTLAAVFAVLSTCTVIALFAYSTFQAAQRSTQARARLSAVLDCDVSLLPRRIAEFQQLAVGEQLSATEYYRTGIGPRFSSRTLLRLAIASKPVAPDLLEQSFEEIDRLPIDDVAAVALELRGMSEANSQELRAVIETAIDAERDNTIILRLAALRCNCGEERALGDARVQKISAALGSCQRQDLEAWQGSFEPICRQLAPHLLQELESTSLSNSQRASLVRMMLGWSDLHPRDVTCLWSHATIEQILESAGQVRGNRQALGVSARAAWRQLYASTFNQQPDLANEAAQLPATLQAWVDHCDGLVRGTLIAFPRLPLADWDRFQTSLDECGYQVLSARPTQAGEQVYVATTVDCSLLETSVTLDIREDELPQRTEEYAAQGFGPISVWARYETELSRGFVRNETNDDLLVSVVWQNGMGTETEIVLDQDMKALGFDGGLSLLNEQVADSFWLQNLDVLIDAELTAEKAENDHVALEVVQPVLTALRSIGLKRPPVENSERAKGYRLQGFPQLSLPESRIEVWERNFRDRDRFRKLLIGPSEPSDHRRRFEAAAKLGFELEDIFVTSGEDGDVLIASRLSARSTYRPRELDQTEAKLAIACWILGDDVPIQTELSAALDPSVRTELIVASEKFGTAEIVKLLDLHRDARGHHLQQAIILMFGRIARARGGSKNDLHEELAHAVRLGMTSQHAGVANAAAWAAAQLGLVKDTASVSGRTNEIGGITRFRSVAGQEMILVKAKQGPSFVGAERLLPLSGNASQSIVTPKHDFAISTHEVTFAEFQQFIVSEGRNTKYFYPQPDYAPNKGGPLVLVSYYGALEYCRWLSKMEGIPDDQIGIPVSEELNPSAVFERNLVELTGYRLPTPVEWQIAVRAGSITDRFIGRCDQALNLYGNTSGNSGGRMAKTGRLMPSPLGLHDVYGNVFERCLLQRHGENGSMQWNPAVRYELIANMGGSFLSHEMYSASNCSNDSVENGGIDHNIGFRIARTIR